LDNYFKNKILSYLNEEATLSKDRLVEHIAIDFPELKESTINVYLSRLKKEGIISNPSRGVNALKGKKSYKPIIDIKLKRLFNKIKKDYPYVEFCIWNTKWLNEFMRHQPFKFYTILEIDKDVTESVFYALKDIGKQVFIDPDSETFDLYISNSEDVIILKHLISEAPLLETENIAIPALEKLLVDMTIDTKVYAAQQSEIEFIYSNAFEKYDVNKSKMKRYAYRRNRENEVVSLTNLTLAKNK
jgi:predicted transcriptional regulator